MESAEIPGVASVTSELTDEDALSSGSLSNRFLIHVGVERGIVLDQSPPSAATVTCSLELATCSLIATLIGTLERGSTSCTADAKPVAVTVRW